MTNKPQNNIRTLIEKGVRVAAPASLEIDDDVDVERISGEDVTIHSGCRLFGGKTLVCRGAVLGQEAPVTLKNCYVGPDVRLKGGYFENAVFLEGVEAGSGAHVRAGTILEEQASIAHTVGLKQTILFPFVTLGSLINFCDCLMAGGSSRSNHSEVGSSYIHFNYTPNQDKATASLIGDVPNGVMLNQNPIFLGGQGGLVGPCRIAYGTVVAAGSIYRKDQLNPDRLVFEGGGRGGSVPYTKGIYRSVKRQTISNFIYMANLVALLAWYTHIRSLFIGDRFPTVLHEGLIDTLTSALQERIKRFRAFCEKMADSKKRYQEQMGETASPQLITQKDELIRNKDQVVIVLENAISHIDRYCHSGFHAMIHEGIDRCGCRYLDVIKGLRKDEASLGRNWLQQIVDDVTKRLMDLFPSIR